MRSSLPTRLLASLSLLLLAGLSARAQFLTAEDFFNSGAQFYISNNIPFAKQRTEMGLQVYPNDEKLQKLEKLLDQQQKQQQQQQQQQKQQEQQQQQNQKDQQKDQKKDQNQQDSQQQQASQSQQDKDKDKDKDKENKEKAQQAKKDAEQKKAQEKQAQEAQKKDETNDETNEVAEANGAHQMTPQEAARLLNSQKGKEEYLTLKPKQKPDSLAKIIKDW